MYRRIKWCNTTTEKGKMICFVGDIYTREFYSCMTLGIKMRTHTHTHTPGDISTTKKAHVGDRNLSYNV